MSVTTTQNSDISTFREIWITALEIEGMCVRAGKIGRAKIGEFWLYTVLFPLRYFWAHVESLFLL